MLVKRGVHKRNARKLAEQSARVNCGNVTALFQFAMRVGIANLAEFGYFPSMKLFSALAIFLAVALTQAFAQQDPDDQYVGIYGQMQQADSLQSTGQPRQALAAYVEAQAALEKFQKIYPDWDQKIVGYRLNYLAGKISDLTAQLPPQTNAPPQTQPATDTNAAISAADFESQIAALRAQVQGLQSDNATLESKLKEALAVQPAPVDSGELAKAQAQIQSLTKENDLLKASLAQASAAPPANSDEMAALREENAMLKKQVAELQAAAAANLAQASVPNPELAKLQAQVAALQSEIQVGSLEKLALENRIRELEAAATNAPLILTSQPNSDARINELTNEANALPAQTPVEVSQPATNKPDETVAVSQPEQQPAANVVAAENNTGELTNAVAVSPEQAALEASQPAPSKPDATVAVKQPEQQPATNSGAAEKSINELPEGSAELVAEAQSYFAAKQYDKAEADYQKILQHDQNNALVLGNLAAIELEQGKLDDAETHIRSALAQSPDDAYDLSILGYLEFRQEKYDDAFDALSRAEELDPKNAEIENYLGVTLSHKGLRSQAETALRRAIELDPNYAAAHNNLAVIYISEDPPSAELARLEYQKALAAGQPRNPDIEKMLAEKGAPLNPP
jgi:tetratricopeptide (TPR) repeat protein